MKLPFVGWLGRKRHLRYASAEAWRKGEGLPACLADIANPAERDRRLAEGFDLRQHLFAQHVSTLPAAQRRQLSDGTHPSQSHRFADRAQPFAAALRQHLAGLGFPADVCVGFYHIDRLVLSADLHSDPGGRAAELPWLYRGFEVKYNWPEPTPMMLVETYPSETLADFRAAVDAILQAVSPQRPNWWHPYEVRGTYACRGTFFRDFYCVAGSVAAWVYLNAARAGVRRVIMFPDESHVVFGGAKMVGCGVEIPVSVDEVRPVASFQ